MASCVIVYTFTFITKFIGNLNRSNIQYILVD